MIYLLQTLFTLLVQYYADLALQEPPSLSLADKLVPTLFEMTQQFPVEAAMVMLDQVKDRQDEYKQICERKAGRGLYPGLDAVSAY